MFGGCLFCLMWSISPYHPTFNDRVMPPGKKKPTPLPLPPLPSTATSTSAFLLSVASAQVSAQLTVCVSPLAGMTMAPHLEGHEIAFNASDRKSWKKYARSMDEYLRRESFKWNMHTSSTTFIPISSCNAYWERKPFVGWVLQLNVFLFFLFSAPLLSGLIRSLKLAERGFSRPLFMHPFCGSLPSLSLSLSALAYNDGVQERKNIRCTQERYFMQDNLDEHEERKACQFKRSWLGECSGLRDPHYGYSQGRPCILLRMNRVRFSTGRVV